MKQVVLLFIICPLFVFSQNYSIYKKTTAMIPMRDGVKLFTTIYAPLHQADRLPILLQRTPYGSPGRDSIYLSKYFGLIAKEGYIFVFQDIRGKFKSEGLMEMNKPMYHKTKPG